MAQSLANLRQPSRDAIDQALDAIRDHLSRVRFGSVAITLHDGMIVQLDLTEKRRIASETPR